MTIKFYYHYLKTIAVHAVSKLLQGSKWAVTMRRVWIESTFLLFFFYIELPCSYGTDSIPALAPKVWIFFPAEIINRQSSYQFKERYVHGQQKMSLLPLQNFDLYKLSKTELCQNILVLVWSCFTIFLLI